MLLESRENIYSDNGEDGVLKCITEQLGGGTCCEFGAWDGKHSSNTFNLVKEKKWKALYIEGDEAKYKDLLATQKEHPTITAVRAYVSPTNLDDLILDHGFPEDLDILSIDVDSIDYEIWKGLKKVRPKIVIIEPSNATPSWEKCTRYEGKGASPHLIKELAKEKGYTFLCTTGNLFFVRDDVDLTPEDDVDFPWWLEPKYKRLVQEIAASPELYDVVVSRVREGNSPWDIKEEHVEDFCTDIMKYVRGYQLGYKGTVP